MKILMRMSIIRWVEPMALFSVKEESKKAQWVEIIVSIVIYTVKPLSKA